jgi:exodeoxyribonuclease VII large subunit
MQKITVTQLNHEVKNILEQGVGEVAVLGEISNLVKPVSGHFYFTLKDKNAQVRCVFFRGRQNNSLLKITDGQKVCAYGSLSLYEPRGDYQLIVEKLEDDGLGELNRLFEKLKAKLDGLGLFASARKREIPKFPNTIAVITSKSGAAIKDILATLNRRNKLAKIFIYHSDVQGANAAPQLIAALNKANQDGLADVIILARGGGSIEDLWAFNDENLAHAIVASQIPVVTGVGHEIDFTIADFVSDLRAATPTAAAEAVSPDMQDISSYIAKIETTLLKRINQYLQNKKIILKHALDMLASPRRLIISYWQKVDYLEIHLNNNIDKYLLIKKHNLQTLLSKLERQNPCLIVKISSEKTIQLQKKLQTAIVDILRQRQQTLRTLIVTLNAVSPLATLDRGYALVMYKGKSLLKSSKVAVGDEINIKLSEGKLLCEVKKIE